MKTNVTSVSVKLMKNWNKCDTTKRCFPAFSGVLQLRLPLLWRQSVVFPRSACDFVPIYHGFVRAIVFLHAPTMVCVLIPSICTNFKIVSFISETMLRVFVFLTFLTEGALSDLLSWFATAYQSSEYHLRRCFSHRFCLFCCFSCRISPHVQKGFLFAMCSLQLSHFVVSSITTSNVPLFTVQLHCACIHCRTSFLILKQLFFQICSVRLVK